MIETPPAPAPDGKCSRDCPHFYYDRMEGWPSAQACYLWDETIDGEEPYYLTDHPCGPAKRLQLMKPTLADLQALEIRASRAEGRNAIHAAESILAHMRRFLCCPVWTHSLDSEWKRYKRQLDEALVGKHNL